LLLADQAAVMQHDRCAARVCRRAVQCERLVVQLTSRVKLALLVQHSAQAREDPRLAGTVGTALKIAERALVCAFGCDAAAALASAVAEPTPRRRLHRGFAGRGERGLVVAARGTPLSATQMQTRSSQMRTREQPRIDRGVAAKGLIEPAARLARLEPGEPQH